MAEILTKYGEVQHAKSISSFICNSKLQKPIVTTSDLRDVVMSYQKVNKAGRMRLLQKVFQALRIVVNHELENLSAFFSSLPALCNKNALVMVITFHSLEQRITDEFMASHVV